MQFFFAGHILDKDRRELRRDGETVAVEPQVFDLLVYLVENRKRVVSKDDLIASVWGGRIVSDSSLTSRINAVRKAIGDSGEEQRLIRTVARKGLRFIGAVQAVQDSALSPGLAQEQPSAALPLPDRPAIAVLPFVNMTSDPDQEYFSDGITEDIITALSKLRWFFVIARNSSFIYKGRFVHLKQIAGELGVRYVLEGSVRKGGDRVRITAQYVAKSPHVPIQTQTGTGSPPGADVVRGTPLSREPSSQKTLRWRRQSRANRSPEIRISNARKTRERGVQNPSKVSGLLRFNDY